MDDSLESFFSTFRENIIGIHDTLEGVDGRVPLVYADWIASGRLYGPIEERMMKWAYPYVSNTHSQSNALGAGMTEVYGMAHERIKKHAGADKRDVIICAGAGMTAVINKLQRILGLRIPEQARGLCGSGPCEVPMDKRPVVFLTHMEHHSNHTSWLECLADVVVLEPDGNLDVDPSELERQLALYAQRPIKIGSFSAGSNVTGVRPPYRDLARIMHRAGGLVFVDFAAAAPYDTIDMHPPGDEEGYLDGVYFSPHKFLGGPGSPGVLVFNKDLYRNTIPDDPGGGTVMWTNRWGEYHYVQDIESREDGGTPAFLGVLRAALAMDLKNQMGIDKMHQREKELLELAFSGLCAVPGLAILAPQHRDRLGALSFHIQNLHYNLIVKLLSDRYGIQVRGGCSCAGTYGHYLFHMDKERSHRMSCSIDAGDLSEKIGWVRLSIHPTMTDRELEYLIQAIGEIAQRGSSWAEEYGFNKRRGEYYRKDGRNFSPLTSSLFFSRLA